jgi:hypothetical protein
MRANDPRRSSSWRGFESRCGTQFALTIDEIKEIANGQCRAIVMHLLPNGRENCGYWEVGSIEGEPGQSLKINLGGASRGQCGRISARRRARKERAGNILQLIAAVKFGHDIGKALKWARSWLGLDNLDPNRLATEKAKASRAARANLEAAAEQPRRIAAARCSSTSRPSRCRARSPKPTYARGGSISAPPARGAGLAQVPSRVLLRRDAIEAAGDGRGRGQSRGPAYRHAPHLSPRRRQGQGDGARGEEGARQISGRLHPAWKGEHDCPMAELPPGTPIYVSEGIEDGLSVALARPSLRVIAAISLSNLGALELPPSCPIYILGQRDEKMRAIEAFAAAVARLQDKGHEVFLIFPPQGVKDYNELLQRDGAGQQGGSNGGT